MVAVTLATAFNLNAFQAEPFPIAGAAQSDYFLKIEGIDGESTDEGHRGEIEILSWSWGTNQMGTGGQAGSNRGGKVNFQDLSVTKAIDGTTDTLMLGHFEGKHFPTAKLTMRKAGGNPQEYYVITLKDVMISSFAQAGDGSQETETISLNYTKIEFDYRAQSSDGSAGNPKTWGWDLSKNKKV